jgi:hypothetical protein
MKMKSDERYTSADFPPLPRGVWWEADRQRFRIRLYSRKKVFRAPYASVRSAGSIDGALKAALSAYEAVLQEVDAHNEKYRNQPDISKASGLLKSIGRSATSIRVNTNGPAPTPLQNNWGIETMKVDRRFK